MNLAYALNEDGEEMTPKPVLVITNKNTVQKDVIKYYTCNESLHGKCTILNLICMQMSWNCNSLSCFCKYLIYIIMIIKIPAPIHEYLMGFTLLVLLLPFLLTLSKSLETPDISEVGSTVFGRTNLLET